MGLDQLDQGGHAVADRQLVAGHQLIKTADAQGEFGRQRAHGGLAVKGGDAVHPRRRIGRMLVQPRRRRRVRVHVAIQNVAHQAVFQGQGEDEIGQKPADIGAGP